MTSFKVTVKQSVAKDLRRIPKKDVAKILGRIEALAVNTLPHGAQKLSRREKYRIRQSVYRIIYEIKAEELVVVAVRVDQRRNVHKNS